MANRNRNPDQPVPGAISRTNFDAHWLRSGNPTEYETIEHRPVTEIDGSRERIRDHLSEAIVDHHLHRRRIADRLAALGHDAAAAFFRDELPRADRTRKGNFGEIVASEHLIQRYGYAMPVFKIRFRDSHNLPMRGEDIVAFRLDARNRINAVIIGEAKTIVRYGTDTVRRAYERLRTAYNPRPMTLGMLSEILYDRGDEAIASQIDDIAIRLTRNAFPRENWIFLICQEGSVDAFRCIDGDEMELENLHCVDLGLSDLSTFVNDLFDRPTLRREPDGDA